MTRPVAEIVTTESVNLNLTIQQAHLVEALLGSTSMRDAKAFGVSEDSLCDLWEILADLLGNPGETAMDVFEINLIRDEEGVL